MEDIAVFFLVSLVLQVVLQVCSTFWSKNAGKREAEEELRKVKGELLEAQSALAEEAAAEREEAGVGAEEAVGAVGEALEMAVKAVEAAGLAVEGAVSREKAAKAAEKAAVEREKAAGLAEGRFLRQIEIAAEYTVSGMFQFGGRDRVLDERKAGAASSKPRAAGEAVGEAAVAVVDPVAGAASSKPRAV
eukprot:3503918-Rhodomonas_salina.1